MLGFAGILRNRVEGRKNSCDGDENDDKGENIESGHRTLLAPKLALF
jgi:hypothetical protein